MSRRHIPIPCNGVEELRLVHWLFGPRDPESPFFNRSKVKKQSVDLVSSDGHKKSSNSVENIVIGSGHDDEQNKQRVSESDCSNELVRRVDEEGKADDERVSEMKGWECGELVLKLNISAVHHAQISYY